MRQGCGQTREGAARCAAWRAEQGGQQRQLYAVWTLCALVAQPGCQG